MPSSPSSVAERARALLEKKAAAELPDAGRVRKGAESRRESSADAFFSALVEGAFLVAAADGELSEDEEVTLAETISHVTGEVLAPDEFVAMIDAYAEALSEDGVARRLEVLAEQLPDAPARREVLAFASLLALCDHNLVDDERGMLFAMGKAFALDDAAVRSVIEGVEASLSEK
ncbi:MAG: hypothetical protein U0165_10305 [Polyangiaceae bacterium]